MAYDIYSKAGTDEAISSALADSLPTTPADIGAATAAQGALADTAVQPEDLGTAAVADAADFEAVGTTAAAVIGSAPVAVVEADLGVATTATFIATIDGIAYGVASNGSLWQSTDDLLTWTQCTGWGGGAFPVDIRPVSGGEVVLIATTAAFRSTGWATNPITATWTQVATPTASINGQPSATFIPSVFDTFGQYVLIGEYAVPRDSATALQLSTDGGTTFTKVFDLNTYYPANIPGSHYHGVAIDGFKTGTPRLWFSHGDDVRGVFYSDDLGATWTSLPSTSEVDLQAKNMMSMSATRYGIVMNTDSYPDGVFRVLRTEAPADMRPEMIGRIAWESAGQSLLGFGQKSVLDPATGLVWQTFKTKKPATGTVDVPGFVFVSDGRSAAIAWRTPQLSTSAVDEVRMGNIGVSESGQVLLTYYHGTTRYEARLTPGGRGGQSRYDLDKGNALTGKALTRHSVGIGVNTVAPGSSVIIGSSAVALAGTAYNEVIIGEGATAGDNSTVVGKGAVGSTHSTVVGIGAAQNASTTEGTIVGRLAKGGTGSAVVGYQADGSGANAIALGKAAKATGSNAIAAGLNAQATGNESRAVGTGTTASTTGALAVGLNASATAVYGIAIGGGAQVAGSYGVALGQAASAAHQDAVALGRNSASTAPLQVAVGARHFEAGYVAAQAAPAANTARLYFKDNGSGKGQLVVRFPTGGEIVVATEA